MLDVLTGALVEVLHQADAKPTKPSISVVQERAATLPSKWRAFARCVSHRESHGNPKAVNRSSGAAGIYQWMPSWRHGIRYIVARGLKTNGSTAKYARDVRERLPYRIEKWSAKWQQIAFVQIINEGGRSAAFRHWSGGHGCNALIP